MKIRNLILCISMLSATIYACTGIKQTPENTVKDALQERKYELIGKKARLSYPEITFVVDYMAENTVHWAEIDSAGIKSQGTEKISFKKLNNHQFFLNWIEKDGFTVSQIIDLEAEKVITYQSYTDENSDRGGRGADFTEGKFDVIE